MQKLPIADHISKYIKEVHDLKAVVVSDYEGVHIFSSFDELYESKREKLIRVVTMIISTIAQCQGNFKKLNIPKNFTSTTYYYNEYLIHFHKSNTFFVSLFMHPRASGLQAAHLAEEISKNFTTISTLIAKPE